MRKTDSNKTDLEECQEKIEALLKEYNCVIGDDGDSFVTIVIRDKDTREVVYI